MIQQEYDDQCSNNSEIEELIHLQKKDIEAIKKKQAETGVAESGSAEEEQVEGDVFEIDDAATVQTGSKDADESIDS